MGAGARCCLYHEHVLVKDAGCATVTPLHADAAYYPLDGRVLSVWVALDAVGGAAAVRFWRRSHAAPLLPEGRLWAPRRFAGGELYADEGEPPPPGAPPPSTLAYAEAPVAPPPEAEKEALSWACAPGDAIVFDARTLHWAPGNAAMGAGPRRAVAFRYCEGRARLVSRPWAPSPALRGEAAQAATAGEWLPPIQVQGEQPWE